MLLALIGALFIGLSLGLLGSGGSILTVPTEAGALELREVEPAGAVEVRVEGASEAAGAGADAGTSTCPELKVVGTCTRLQSR